MPGQKTSPDSLAALETPALILNMDKAEGNVARLTEHLLAAAASRDGKMSGVQIEIDCDGHRGGLAPDDRNLVKIANILRDAALELRGVLTHAGESYGCRNGEGLAEAAEGERILPNHACATGAQHDQYHVTRGSGEVVANWARIRGW